MCDALLNTLETTHGRHLPELKTLQSDLNTKITKIKKENNDENKQLTSYPKW